MSEYTVTEHDKVMATAEAMQRQGGSFVKHLGAALMVAYPINKFKIRIAFNEYFQEYWYVAEQHNWYMDE